MPNTAISVENVSKQYHLGTIGTGTFRNDLKLWWAKARNKPNPLALVDETDHGNRDNDILWALRDVSFKVEQGEALGIIGRNGAGKSTLLKILSRVTTPTSGEVKVKGRIASLLEVGTGFHPELTGRENIFLNGAIMGMSRTEVARKFDEIVDFSGVERFIDTPVKRYSSGMYVRLGFAVAAHLEPEILIVDEVLAVGDAEFQKKCLGKMGDVTQEGRTVLFVSHNMAAIKQLCKNGVLIEKGTVNCYESIDVVTQKYINSSLSQKESLHKGEIIISEKQSKYIKSVTLLDEQDQSTDTFFMGKKLKIKIRIKQLNKISKARLGVSFNTLDGQRIFIFDTDMISNLDKVPFSTDDFAYLVVNHLPLLPDTYTFDIIIAQHVGGRVEIINNIIHFNVISDDIFNNSYLLSKIHGLIFNSDAYWRIENNEE
jgi:lipopolysaccharide transport system ATP-binding protein